MAIRIIQTITGKGVVRSKDGKRTPVKYELTEFQEEIRAGHMEDPNASIPGLKQIRGWVDPVCFPGDELTLELHDRRKLMFFFKDTNGNIVGSGDFF